MTLPPATCRDRLARTAACAVVSILALFWGSSKGVLAADANDDDPPGTMLVTYDDEALGEEAEEFAASEEDSIWAMPAAFLFDQPPPTNEPATSAPQPARRRYRGSRSFLNSGDTTLSRLASAPNMFGDLNSMAGQIDVYRPGGAIRVDLPLAGGTRRLKVSENNKPIPMDRVFYNYSHFEDAVLFQSDLLTPGSPSNGNPIDRHIVGAEKTFFDGWSSLEIRMPFTNGVDFAATNFSLHTAGIGNLVLTGKQLLAVGDNWAVAAGLGVELPTGSGVNGAINGIQYNVQNRATHLFPYVGFLALPSDYCFVQGYLQFDFATGGNPVTYSALVPPPEISLREQHMLHADLAAGCWLYSDFDAPYVTGVAALLELHYAGTIQTARIVDAVPQPGISVSMGNHYNAVDILNLTAGLHFELAGRTTVRIGASAPLRAEPDRFFNSELQFSINRYF